MLRRGLLVAFLASVACLGTARAQGEAIAERPLAAMDALVGSWRAAGTGFESTLSYRWLIDGTVLEAVNDVYDAEGKAIGRYRGAYAWDAGRGAIVFWVAGANGEVHRGRAWWDDGVLWHEAEVSGGAIDLYASAIRPGVARFAYYADYGASEATPALLTRDPLVYVEDPAGS